jgi:two-component system chemotaxis sensor kinase CheA
MGDMTSEGASISAGIDLSQFYQVFFEEAGENLDNMEQLLLNVNVDAADDEELNAIFRCAHSIKGGAATFGFSDVAELTHQMETLLDKLRRHELQPNAAMVDVLLQSGDALRAQLGRHQASSKAVPARRRRPRLHPPRPPRHPHLHRPPPPHRPGRAHACWSSRSAR